MLSYDYTAHITFPDEETRIVRSNNLRDLSQKIGCSTSTIVRMLTKDCQHSRLKRNVRVERQERSKNPDDVNRVS